jgi:hypothetical protein
VSAPPRLHVVHRSTARDNAKPRPVWYDKSVCLLSLVRAARACDRLGEVVLLNVDDAPMPPDRLALQRELGRVETVPATGMGATYRRCLEVATGSGWADDDLVYLAEDDYLLLPHALSALVAAADALPAHYLALYAAVLGEEPNGTDLPPELRLPPALSASTATEVDGVRWRRAVSSNLSVGARVATLREDLLLHRVAPSAGSWFDHFLSLAVQGQRPCTARQLLLPVQESPHLGRRARIAVWRAVLTAGALRRRRDPHVLVSAVPPLACHAETGYLAAGTDWAAVAADTRAWGAREGLGVW